MEPRVHVCFPRAKAMSDLLKDLARTRTIFTGESYSTAKASILSYAGYSNPLPRPETEDQAALEADILTALVGFEGQDPWWPDDRPLVLESVSPNPDTLDIVVAPENLITFCWRVLPCRAAEANGERPLVPGIEPRRVGSHTLLTRRGTGARIRLRGTSWHRWTAACKQAYEEGLPKNPPPIPSPPPGLIGPHLLPGEGSQMLRRAGVFCTPGHGIDWLRSGALDVLTWEYMGDPGPAELETLLNADGPFSVGDERTGPSRANIRELLKKSVDNHSRRRDGVDRRIVMDALRSMISGWIGHHPIPMLDKHLNTGLRKPALVSIEPDERTLRVSEVTIDGRVTVTAAASIAIEVDGLMDHKASGVRMLTHNMAVWERYGTVHFTVTVDQIRSTTSTSILDIRDISPTGRKIVTPRR